MEELYLLSKRILKSTENQRERSLSIQIDWNHRLIGINGISGSGKTNLLLNRINELLLQSHNPLYISLDHLYFLDQSLIDVAEEFALQGGTHLFLDNVHKYPNWTEELKLIYRELPNLKVIFVHPATLGLSTAKEELGKRVEIHNLNEMSFREFLNIKHNLSLPIFDLDYILKNHIDAATLCKENIEFPIAEFKKYLKFGCYPYLLEDLSSDEQKLLDTFNSILETDVSIVENISFQDILKIKRLLVTIAKNNPLKPNITQLSKELGISRNFLLNALRILSHAKMIHKFHSDIGGIGKFTKPLKLYLNNTNLVYAFPQIPIKQSVIRETFLINQVSHKHKIHLGENDSFVVDKKYIFYLGKKNEIHKRLEKNNTYFLCDDIEIGTANIIPLYLFGMLY